MAWMLCLIMLIAGSFSDLVGPHGFPYLVCLLCRYRILHYRHLAVCFGHHDLETDGRVGILGKVVY